MRTARRDRLATSGDLTCRQSPQSTRALKAWYKHIISARACGVSCLHTGSEHVGDGDGYTGMKPAGTVLGRCRKWAVRRIARVLTPLRMSRPWQRGFVRCAAVVSPAQWHIRSGGHAFNGRHPRSHKHWRGTTTLLARSKSVELLNAADVTGSLLCTSKACPAFPSPTPRSASRARIYHFLESGSPA